MPDHIHVENDGQDSPGDLEAICELVNRSTIVARIERLRRHAQLAAVANELHALAMEKGAGKKDIEDDMELRARVAEAEQYALYFGAEELPQRTYRAKQSSTAKKCRPKSNPTCKSITVVAMAKARVDGLGLQSFLDSAEAGSVSGLTIANSSVQGVQRYVIDADDVTEQKQVARRTIEDWWTEAAKISAAN
jgi:hypothetical protein